MPKKSTPKILLTIIPLLLLMIVINACRNNDTGNNELGNIKARINSIEDKLNVIENRLNINKNSIRYKIVDAEILNVRSSPSFESDNNIMGALISGDIVEIIESGKKFTRIGFTTYNGEQLKGYVASNLLRTIKSSELVNNSNITHFYRNLTQEILYVLKRHGSDIAGTEYIGFYINNKVNNMESYHRIVELLVSLNPGKYIFRPYNDKNGLEKALGEELTFAFEIEINSENKSIITINGRKENILYYRLVDVNFIK